MASSWPPRHLSPVGRRRKGDGANVIEFTEAMCRIVKDSVAGRTGDLMKLRSWQRQLITSLYLRRPDGRLQHRQALIGMPRKNGKSALGSALALHALYLGQDGGEVYSCAADKDQARIVFGSAKRMVELDPELAESSKLYKDAIEVPSTGSVYRVLSSEAFTKEGLSPTFVLFDEVHAQPNDELWNVMALAMGARVDPLMVGITTAGAMTDSLGNDSLCYRLYQHGRQVSSAELDDPSFFFAWWEPSAGTEADHADPAVWAEANPGFDDIVSAEDFESSIKRTPESEFRTKRTNVWVAGQHSALPNGAWAKLDTAPPPPDGTDCVLFVDGSWSGDSTGIVGCTLDGHLWTVGVWESPGTEGWRVPVAEVEEAIRVASRRWNAVEVAFDPFRWQRTMQALEDEGLPVVEYVTGSLPRIIPAWKKFYDAVVDGEVTHDGDPALARHLENMVLKSDAKGSRPVKESRMSKRHIDLGICAVCAFDEATRHRAPAAGQAPFVMTL